MRRLPSLTTPPHSPLPRLSSNVPIVSPPSLSSCRSTAASSAYSFAAGVKAVLFFSAAGMSTAAAAARPAASAGRSSRFTSFEVESELHWAQEERRGQQTTSATAPSRTLPQFLDESSHLKGKRSTQLSGRQPTRPDTGIEARPIIDVPAPSLPHILQHRRWCDEAHARLGISTPGYVDAAQHVLIGIYKVWIQQRESITVAQTVEEQSLAALTRSILHGAHGEALIAVLELAVSPRSSNILCGDAKAPQQEFEASFLPCVVQLICLRHAELSGRHVAHVSRLLCSYSPIFVAAPQHAVVWESFLFLCYATRRRLRRRHNRDCLEAFLWGLYNPLIGEEGGRRSADRTHLSHTVKHAGVQLHARRTTQPNSPLNLPNRKRVRRATLQHLLYRCLQTGASAQITPQAAAHVDLLLSWCLLLAGDDVQGYMRDAVVHRLCKSFTPSCSCTCTGGQMEAPVSVKQWKRLALQHHKLHVEQVSGSGQSRHGKHGKALVPGPAVFASVDRVARQTSSWSVPAVERDLLLGVLHSKRPHAGTMGSPSWVERTGCVKRTRCATAGRTESQLRLIEATAATLRAYARLRWEPLHAALRQHDGPAMTDTTATRKKATTSSDAAAPSVCLSTQRQASCEQETVELVYTALELPQYAWCLAEAVAVRLVRCLRLRSTYAVAAPTTTPLTRRQILAAFRRLARHSRVDTLAHALVLQGEGTAAPPGGAMEENGRGDPLSFAAFTTEATFILAEQLHAADHAVHVVEAWWQERSVAATPLPVYVLRRLCAWVGALPPPLRSTELASTLEQLSRLETSVPATTALAVSYAPTGNEAEVGVCEARQLWEAIVSAAQPLTSAATLKVPNGDAYGVSGSAGSPAVPSPCSSSPFHDASAWHATTSQSRGLLRRLQWIALLNNSPRREEQWSDLDSTSTGATTGARLRAELRRIVEASEREELTVAEQDELTDLGCRCFRRRWEAATASWSELYTWRWLDELLARDVCHADGAQRTEDYKSGHVGNSDKRCTAASAEGSLHGVFLSPCGPPSSQIILHFVRAACTTSRTLSAGGVKQANNSPLLAAADAMETPLSSPTPAPAVESWKGALRTLASYCKHLASRIERAEHGAVRAADVEKLHSAASAFIRCFVGFWQALRGSPLDFTVPHSTLDASSALYASYKTVLDMHFAMAQIEQGASLPHPPSVEATASPLPSLPVGLHEDVFRLLTDARVPQWQQCEALLFFADDVATLCSAAGMASCRGQQVTAERSTLARPPSFEVPLTVYAEVLAAYAVHQQPVPQPLRERCMRRL